MKMFFSIYLALVGLVHLVNASPALLWGPANFILKPSLPLISKDKFQEILKPLLEDHMIIAFLEKNLTAGDFLCLLPETKETCWPYLSQVHPKAYYANVEQSADALLRLASPPYTRYLIKSTDSPLASRIQCNVGKLHIVDFENSILERSELLKHHDTALEAQSHQLECPIVYIYTSSIDLISPKLNRLRRQLPNIIIARTENGTDNSTSPGGHFFQQGHIHIFFTDIELVKPKEKPVKLEFTEMKWTRNGSGTFVDLTGTGKGLSFELSLVNGYSCINSFVYDGKIFSVDNVSAPKGFSYYCGQLTAKNGATKLLLNGLQFEVDHPIAQPIIHTRKKTKIIRPKITRRRDGQFKFAKAWDCVGFITPGIAMGIFAMMFFLGGCYCGISWIIDVETNDRFETKVESTYIVDDY